MGVVRRAGELMALAPLVFGGTAHVLLACGILSLVHLGSGHAGLDLRSATIGIASVVLGCCLTTGVILLLSSGPGPAESNVNPAVDRPALYRAVAPLWALIVTAFIGGNEALEPLTFVGVTWSAAILVSLLLPRTHPGSRPSLRAQVLGGIGWTGTALSMIAVSTIVSDQPGPLDPGLLATIVGLATTSALAWILGWCVSEIVSRDLRELARAVDATILGDETACGIEVTRSDEVGELQHHVERLRKQLQRELLVYQQALEKTRAADARKAEFLGAVSHELRTPLNVVGGFSQLLLEGAGGPLSAPQREDVELIFSGGRHLLELINDILDLSMIESGELRLNAQQVDIGQLLQDAMRMHRSLVHDKPVELTCDLGPPLPSVCCDAKRVAQVVHNLLSNAIKFTERGTITIRASYDPQADAISIRCSDTGSGIAAEDLSIIFEEYRQTTSVSRSARGTGLGLAIARRIALAHGGDLVAASTPGEGSEFTLTLPLVPRPDPTRGPQPHPLLERDPSRPISFEEATG